MDKEKLNELVIALTIAELRQIVRQEVDFAFEQRGITPIEEKEDELLSIAALANYLGVSKPTIHSYRERKLLPLPSYIGTRPRWSKNEVDESMKSRSIKVNKKRIQSLIDKTIPQPD